MSLRWRQRHVSDTQFHGAIYVARVCWHIFCYARITVYYPTDTGFLQPPEKNPIEKSLVFWQDSEQQNWLRPSNFGSLWIIRQSCKNFDQRRALISRSRASLWKVAARFPPLFFHLSIVGSWIMWRTFHITSNFPADKSGWAWERLLTFAPAKGACLHASAFHYYLLLYLKSGGIISPSA